MNTQSEVRPISPEEIYQVIETLSVLALCNVIELVNCEIYAVCATDGETKCMTGNPTFNELYDFAKGKSFTVDA